MNVTKDVIHDLLPLYLAGECSRDTRGLIDEYIASHPETKRLLDRMASPSPALPQVSAPAQSAEVRALAKTRSNIRMRSVLMGVAIFFSLAPFSFVYTGEKTYALLAAAPAFALGYGVIGAACWIGYFAMKRKSGNF